MLDAAARWARGLREAHPEVIRVGCFGSYARGDHVPSSDLDLFVEVASSPEPRWIDRPAHLPYPTEVPVGVEIFVYTSDEVAGMREAGSSWIATITAEMVWL